MLPRGAPTGALGDFCRISAIMNWEWPIAVVLVSLTPSAFGAEWAKECAAQVKGQNVWERAKTPELREFCDLLASAASKLVGSGATPGAALKLAEIANHVVPGRATPLTLKRRALT